MTRIERQELSSLLIETLQLLADGIKDLRIRLIGLGEDYASDLFCVQGKFRFCSQLIYHLALLALPYLNLPLRSYDKSLQLSFGLRWQNA